MNIGKTIPFVFFITLSLLMFSCSEKKAEAVIPSYKAATLQLSEGVVEVEFPTSLKSQQVIEIRPRVEGVLERVCFQEGRSVKKGQLLFQINQDSFLQNVYSCESQLFAAEAKLSNAELDVQKLKPLVEKNIISEYELKSANMNKKAAEANVNQAKAALEQAKINLGYTSITSPVSGVVSTITIREGSLVQVQNQTPMTTISADGDMFAYFSVSEKIITTDRNLINLPLVSLKLADGYIYTEKGKIDAASGIVNPTTGTILLKAVFPNKNRTLTTGLSGVLVIPFEVKEAILVPKSATYQLLDKTMAVLVDANNITHSQAITVLGMSGDNMVVSEGLKAGDVIVLEGVSKLRDGKTIKPILN